MTGGKFDLIVDHLVDEPQGRHAYANSDSRSAKIDRELF